jgi:hypothetical protein
MGLFVGKFLIRIQVPYFCFKINKNWYLEQFLKIRTNLLKN